MLTSIIFSMALTAIPTTENNTNDINNMDIHTKIVTQLVDEKRGAIRIGEKRGAIRIGEKRGAIRIGEKRGAIRIGEKRGAIRIGEKRGAIRI